MRALVIVSSLFIASCSGSSAPTTESTPAPRQSANPLGTCPLTIPNGQTPPDNSAGMNHGNGKLYTAMWPYDVVIASGDQVKQNGAIDMKWAWYRVARGQVSVSGRRLDRKAPPLTAAVSRAGFGDRGFQPSTIHFPTPGCWQVKASVGKTELTFVALIVKASSYGFR